MAYTIQKAFDNLAGMAHGRSINKITNPFSVAERAADALLGRIDPEDTKRYTQIVLYDQVTDYALPMTDLKEKAIFDIRPQVNRHQRDNLGSRMSKDFDMKKGDDDWGAFGSFFSIEDDTGERYIRILKKLNPGASAIDSLDDSTQWLASGGANSLVDDTVYAVDESGTSLRFNLSSNGSPGYLTSTRIVTGDQTDFALVASFFLWVYLPNSAADITTVKLRIGSDANNYWELDNAVIQQGTQQRGWNLFRFDWSGSTIIGNPNPAAITYCRIELDYPANTTVNGVRVNKLFASLPRVWDIGYYSDSLFNIGVSTWQNTVDDVSNGINVSITTWPLYLNELGKAAAQQLQGKDAEADINHFENELNGNPRTPDKLGLYDKYESRNPDQREKVTQTWYGRNGRLGYKRK